MVEEGEAAPKGVALSVLAKFLLRDYPLYVSLRAKVENGRLVVDEPTTLPEGTVLDLVVDDEGDDLDQEEQAVLQKAISAAWESAKAGKVRPASAIIEELRSRK